MRKEFRFGLKLLDMKNVLKGLSDYYREHVSHTYIHHITESHDLVPPVSVFCMEGRVYIASNSFFTKYPRPLLLLYVW